MAIHLLSLRQIQSAAAKSSAYSLKDGGSLYLNITPSGNKLWRYRYRLGSSVRVYSIGKFPDISLSEARKERDRARDLVRQGIHPLAEKKSRLILQIEQSLHTFEYVAQRWIEANTLWSQTYQTQVQSYLQRDVLPMIGKLPITTITVAHLRTLVLQVSERGPTAAIAVQQWTSQIFNYGAQQGLCEHDPAALLRRFIKRPPYDTTHHFPGRRSRHSCRY